MVVSVQIPVPVDSYEIVPESVASKQSDMVPSTAGSAGSTLIPEAAASKSSGLVPAPVGSSVVLVPQPVDSEEVD